MTDAELTIKLADKLGGRDALAAHFGIGVTAVNNWVGRDRIGLAKRPQFRDLARQHGIKLSEKWIIERVVRAGELRAA